jgi:hypothetical protein
MSEEFESEPQTEDSGINPIGKYLIYAVVLIVVIATVYGIFHTGIDLGVRRQQQRWHRPGQAARGSAGQAIPCSSNTAHRDKSA